MVSKVLLGHIGQKVCLSFSFYDDAVYPGSQGLVQTLSASASADAVAPDCATTAGLKKDSSRAALIDFLGAKHARIHTHTQAPTTHTHATMLCRLSPSNGLARPSVHPHLPAVHHDKASLLWTGLLRSPPPPTSSTFFSSRNHTSHNTDSNYSSPSHLI